MFLPKDQPAIETVFEFHIGNLQIQYPFGFRILLISLISELGSNRCSRTLRITTTSNESAANPASFNLPSKNEMPGQAGWLPPKMSHPVTEKPRVWASFRKSPRPHPISKRCPEGM